MVKEEVIAEIRLELNNLKRLNKEMKELLITMGDNPNFIEIRAAGSILHDFYCGVE